MIRKQAQKDGSVKITFALPDATGPVALIADVNGWDPCAHPLKKRSNGQMSVAVTVSPGQTVRFRYATAGGEYFDDPEADAFEPNGLGQTHAVVTC
ncbi:MAG: isoamylase early set domain-containing protein [Acidimicrobiia bacterium]